ncbi:MAG: type II toxin-antitoxin system RelE/ParE family toxin [Ignavibacteriae bacterium]|nr:type II toxin-antitoxin system RelE/ParE family toxin [Ignavibacteriota bacterium]
MSKYKIQIAESAEKSLAKIPKRDRSKIIEKIESLKEDSRPTGYIKLKGSSKVALYRIRYGDYRMVYTVKDENLIILILEIGNRKEVYS